MFCLELTEYADIAYEFMRGIQGWGSSGYCMMDPETLKKQRWTYVKYWLDRLTKDRKEVKAALSG